MEYEPVDQFLRQSETWSQVVRIGIAQPTRVSILASHKDRGGSAAAERQIGVGVSDVDQRIHEFVSQAHFHRSSAGQTEAILRESGRVPLPQLHLRDACLPLLHGWKP